jgi:DNA repair protein RadC
LAASRTRRAKVLVQFPAVEAHLVHIRAAMLHALREQVLLGPTIGSTAQLAEYLRFDMAHHALEQVRVLFLASGNRLIADEVIAPGSVDSAPLLTRPILVRALDIGAAGLIIIHNHPGGDPKPSQADILATRELVYACKPLDIAVHDHLIVAKAGWTSLRLEGLI